MHPAHPLQAVTHPDPYPYYAALARERPLYREAALDLWVASHPDAIAAIMQHPAARVRPAAEPVPKALCPGPAGELFGRFVRMNDSATHTQVKALLSAYLREQSARPCTPACPDPGPLDAAAVDRYLSAAPVHAQAAFLGLPPDLYADCAADIAAFLSALPAAAAADRIEAGHAAAQRLQTRLESHLQAPDAAPALRRLREDGARAEIAPAVLAANLAGLLFQSCEAGAGLLGNAIVLAGRRGLRADLTDAAALALVDDVERSDPPLHNTRRFLAAGIDVGGLRIEAGQTVLLVLAAAATVQPEAHWTFGAFGHACPGRLPARQHAAGALTRLLRAGLDAAALAARFRYRPLPNARVPQFDFSEEQAP
ncbi:cytochrome [Achromobacter aegrifaciens]|uniref:cytochrome n=1 Tax=Achromobacter aegrifaciens TaxID=1287736 RepID=UPI00278EFC7F|nr:cytochrome [Achromobacter aegrifaciens]MDQ1758860.1 cytochrome [Achromobacter aegrifaciens]